MHRGSLTIQTFCLHIVVSSGYVWEIKMWEVQIVWLSVGFERVGKWIVTLKLLGQKTKRQKCSWNEWECIRDRNSFNWKSVTVIEWVDIKKSCWFRYLRNTSTNISKYDFVFSPVEVLNMTIHTKYMFLSRLFSTYLNL